MKNNCGGRFCVGSQQGWKSGCSKLIKEIGEHPKVQITSKLWDCAEMKMCRKRCSEELFFEFAKETGWIWILKKSKVSVCEDNIGWWTVVLDCQGEKKTRDKR